MRVKVLTERPMGRKIIKILKSLGEEIVEDNPDMLIVAYYSRIIKPEEFNAPRLGTINLHPGLLPYNRGMYPHIWPLIDDTPAGITIHYIDDQIDHGEIIAQEEVEVKITDTAGSLEKRIQKRMLFLFKLVWISKFWFNVPVKQMGKGTLHYAKEILTIQRFDKDTIMRLRACTFDDRSYGYFMHEGQRIYVGAKFFTQDDIDKFNETNK